MKEKILVIDDNIDILLLISKILSDYEVFTSDNSLQGMEIWQKENPDLVLLDIELKEGTGYEVLTDIKQVINKLDTLVIFLSARSNSTAKVMAYNLGAINYIEKPFDKAEIRAIVARTLKFKKVFQQKINLSEVELDLEKRFVSYEDEKVFFTDSEFLIFKKLFSHPEVVFSRDDLMDALGKSAEGASDRRVDTLISQIRRKLNNFPIKIESVYKRGYRVLEENQSQKAA